MNRMLLETPQCLFKPDSMDYAHILSRLYLNRVNTTMAEQLPLVRQWILLRTLCSRRLGVTVKDMVHELNVSEKTIRRDLETFQAVGFPLKEVVEEFGRKTWHIEPGKAEPGLSFAYDEAIALYLGRRFLEPLAGTVFWEAAQRAFTKLRSMLGPEALKYIEHFGTMFHQTMVGVGDYTKQAELIDQLMVGIEDRKAVSITYKSQEAKEPGTYEIYPYGLIYHRGSLYVAGRSAQYEEIRHWKVSRIENAEVSDVQFEWPEDFDLQQHLSKSFGVYHSEGDVTVKVWFAASAARYVSESNWHGSQKLTPQDDGSLLAEFQLSGTEEIKRWIMSFGHNAVVQEPKALREEIAEELNSLLAKYR